MMDERSRGAPGSHYVSKTGHSVHMRGMPAKMDRIMDPVLRAQLNKIEVVADQEIEALFPELQRVIVTIHTTDGRELTKQVDYPRGDPRNPLTDQEIEEKFDALCEPVLTEQARTRIKDAVSNLENLGFISELLEMTKTDTGA